MMPDCISIDTARGSFTARTAGEPGHPIALCVHGFADDAGSFDDLLGWLAGHGFHALALYRRGYAPSPLQAPNDEHDPLATASADLRALAEALAPAQSVSLVAHGYGAIVGYHALQHAPDRFSRAVMLSAAHPGLKMRWWSRIRCAFASRRFRDIETYWRNTSPAWSVPVRHLAAVKRTFAASGSVPHHEHQALHTRTNIGLIRTPTLQLFGEHDVRSASISRMSQERFFTGASRVEVVPLLGHFLHLEAPKLIANQIVDWLTMPAPTCIHRPDAVRVFADDKLRIPVQWRRVLSWKQPVPTEWSRFAG